MPNKTIYLRDEDVAVFERAREMGGDSVSAVVVEALRRFVEEEEERAAREARAEQASSTRNRLLAAAAERNAAHLHVEPLGNAYRIRMRTGGGLETVDELPGDAGRHLIELLADQANITGDRGRGRLPIEDRPPLDVTVDILPTATGPSASLRILRPETAVRALDRLGGDDAQTAALERIADHPFGLVLTTGPTGCGKTTTLQSMLAHATTPQRKVFSVEDPVERILNGVTQVPVRREQGETIRETLRDVARCDPDIIYVSEVRDPETAQLCVQLAATGHLLFTLLHAPTAPAALVRLIDAGAEPFLVRDAVRGVVAQRLVRRLCTECRRRTAEGDGFEPVGCETCHETGYRGRRPLYQILEPGPEVGQALVDGVDAEGLEAVARAEGLPGLRELGMKKVQSGETSRSEVIRVTGGGRKE